MFLSYLDTIDKLRPCTIFFIFILDLYEQEMAKTIDFGYPTVHPTFALQVLIPS
jgi:hypothetical protein